MLGAQGLCALACACSFNTEGASGTAADGTGASTAGTAADTMPGVTASAMTLDDASDAPTTGAPSTTSADSGEPPSDGSTSSDPPSTSGTDTGGSDGLAGDDALLVRYFLDEASSGAARAPILDAGPPPALDLEPFYSSGQPNYVEDDGHRGLRWDDHGSGGRGQVALADTKLAALDGTTAVTFELVVDVTSVFMSEEPYSRLVVVQPDVEPYGIEMGLLTSWHEGNHAIDFRASWDPGAGPPIARWSLAEHPERFVAHIVVDTTDPPAGFLRMFLDGQEVDAVFNDEGPPGVELEVGADSFLLLGNRPNDNASFGGAVYYLAIYGRPLDDGEVAHNAALLASDDDSPG